MPTERPPRRRVYPCFECGLPDAYNGQGDGIGSCMCPRCEWCGWAPGVCNCSDDEFFDDYCTAAEGGGEADLSNAPTRPNVDGE